MEIKYTMDLIYNNCANRIKEKIEEKNIKHKEIFDADPKIISRIINVKIGKKRNPYLIQYAVLCSIQENLEFKNNQEVMWGTHEEIEFLLPVIFQHIMFDLLLSDDTGNLIDSILCGYAPYARYSAYRNLLFDSVSPISRLNPSLFYEVDEGDAEMDIFAKTDEAIVYFFTLCRNDFKKIYLSFTDSRDTFSKWDKYFKQWITDEFLVMLSKFAPSENSVGLRIKNLIKSDYPYIPRIRMIDDPSDPEVQTMIKIVSATENYIKELENIQTNCANYKLFR